MESGKPDDAGTEKKQPPRDRRRLYGALAAAAIVGLALILLLSSGEDDSAPAGETITAEVVSVDSLRDTVSGQEPPVYWAGEQAGAEVELSRPDVERTYVRYLTDGAEAGDQRADFLTVGTYTSSDPVASLRRQGSEPGGVIAKAPGGATVYFNRKQPKSVYLAYPGVDAQIEVFDPNFTRALQLVNSGQIVPVN